jgi:hypothetical protein
LESKQEGVVKKSTLKVVDTSNKSPLEKENAERMESEKLKEKSVVFVEAEFVETQEQIKVLPKCHHHTTQTAPIEDDSKNENESANESDPEEL